MPRKQFMFERRALLIVVALLSLGALAAPPAAFSQSCALCYTQAASAGVQMIKALRSGILVLIVPPTLMSVCMIFIVRRKSNRFRREGDASDSSQEW
jgi:hypothetical protein